MSLRLELQKWIICEYLHVWGGKNLKHFWKKGPRTKVGYFYILSVEKEKQSAYRTIHDQFLGQYFKEKKGG